MAPERCISEHRSASLSRARATVNSIDNKRSARGLHDKRRVRVTVQRGIAVVTDALYAYVKYIHNLRIERGRTAVLYRGGASLAFPAVA